LDIAPGDTSLSDALLSIRDLRVSFPGRTGAVRAVDGLDLDLASGRVLCLVGESGSGKSLTALALMRLIASPPAAVSAARLVFDGSDLSTLDAQAMTRIRGNRMAMIFQEPMTSLNPVFTVGEQIAEVVIEHRGLGRAEARAAALEMLRRVRIPGAEARLDAYPHQLSGGMRQRVMIAMALACKPQLLIADEPTTALDVTIQAQILALIDELRRALGTAVLLITHNLGVVAEIGDEVAVMYAGRVVERASATQLFDDPLHPYTLALLAAMPRIADVGRRLAAIPGSVPLPGQAPGGCRFHPRCPFASARCREETPPLSLRADGHAVACWHAPGEAPA
jgi:peptide/nickel transport system ATP-binding protein